MAIEVEKISFCYEKGNNVIDELSTKIRREKITAIIGPNGSGKTTFLENLTGLSKINSGKIKISNNKKGVMGISFQFPEEQIFESTVYKEILFGMKSFNYKVKNKKKRVVDSLNMVGLNISYLNKNPFNLSAGEKRRLSIASVLAFNPKIIVLDEPTVGLDDKGKKVLRKLLIKLKKSYSKTIIIVSHDIDFLYEFIDDFIVIKNGKCLIDLKKEEFLENADFLRKNNIDLPQIVSFIDFVYKKKKVKLGNHPDVKELMKAIYRDVE